MRTFYVKIQKDHQTSCIYVAEGVEFASGKIFISYYGVFNSVVMYDNIDDMKKIVLSSKDASIVYA